MTHARPRVLFVDDDPDLLDSMADLWSMEFEVDTAMGGEAGLAAAARHRPHVVVSDMRMPGMDGATFLTQVKACAPAAVRLLLTGHADVDAAVRAVNHAGVFRFLLKPCSAPAMGQALRDAVEHHRLHSADRDLLAAEVARLSRQLVHAERLATLGTMSASLGHEMNNALTILQSAVEAVRHSVGTGQAPDGELLEYLVAGKDRLVAQARGALSLARRAPRQVAVLDLGAVVREVVTTLGHVGVTRRTALTVTCAEPAPLVRADRTELEQIVINLVKNAADAIAGRCGDGHIAVEVTGDGPSAVLTVHDDGGGIPPDQLAQVFEPYFTTKPAGAGTGLGLPVTRRLLAAADGTIAVTSQWGHGTTVTCRLPIAEPTAEPTAAGSPRPRPRSSSVLPALH